MSEYKIKNNKRRDHVKESELGITTDFLPPSLDYWLVGERVKN